ncbi:phage minor head protein [Marvinbryantia formatexigens]|nr:phage minor head protein [Marvinbryantia formatexigens]UWO25249.1 phage head morphogenesis protein [Marvinbryantia formatexigens DSM 14469]SDH04389.1 Phage Mu protein F like protein [Marvinbryantia formatexigens]
MALCLINPQKRKISVKKNEESQEALDRLQECLEEAQEGPVRLLERFWRDQAMVLTYAELRAIVTEDNIPGTVIDDWQRDYAKLIADKVTPVWRAAMAAGVRSNPVLDGMEIDAAALAKDWIADHGAELVTNLVEEQVQAIRYVMGESVRYQMGSAETAQYIRPVIGLTESQTAANMKYYNSIKEQMMENHPRMQKETIERKARESAARYASKQHRSRAETIARTEIVTAYHEGNDRAVRDGIRNNAFPRMRKEWSTSLDDKVCPACMALEGVAIDMEEEFSVKSGKRTITKMLPPLHPRCACAIKYVESSGKDAIIRADKIIEGHDRAPKEEKPGVVIDHIGKNGKADIRTYYDSLGMKRREVHTTDHGNSGQHPYGKNGEHVHIYAWDTDGRLKKRIVREVYETERKENGDIL